MDTHAYPEQENKLRLYLDAHIAKQLAIQLRLKNVDVIRCQELGFDNQSDIFHFEYAAQEKRALVTSDEDFLNLAKERQNKNQFHAGVIYVSHQQKENIGLQVRELLFLHDSIIAGAATLEIDVYNQVRFIGLK